LQLAVKEGNGLIREGVILNINSAVSVSSAYSLVQNRKFDVERPALATGTPGDIKALDVDAAPGTLETADKIELYEYEEKPWESEKWYMENLTYDYDRRRFFIFMQEVDKISQLHTIKIKFKEFSDYITDQRSDIASIKYGFTLDEVGKIKILDPHQKLSESDKSWLTEKINTFNGLSKTVNSHFQTLMTLIDHADSLGKKYNLNRHNFQTTIDYGNILNIAWDSLNKTFDKMLNDNSERRPEPSIDTLA